jgi:hypothetical protein
MPSASGFAIGSARLELATGRGSFLWVSRRVMAPRSVLSYRSACNCSNGPTRPAGSRLCRPVLKGWCLATSRPSALLAYCRAGTA